MGMAHGAIAEGPDAGYWNPAALAFIETSHAANVTYSSLKGVFDLDFPFVHAAYAARTSKLEGAVAVSFSYFDLGEGTDTMGETYTLYELAPAVSYGGRLSDELALGIGLKMYRIDYSNSTDEPDTDFTDTTVLFDAGMLWRGVDSRLLLGGSVQNLGPGLELGSDGDSSPPTRNVKLAFGARLVDMAAGQLLTACDLNIPIAGEDNSPRLMAGAEMLVGEHAALRIGFRYDGWFLGDDDFADEQQLYATTMGFGVRVKGFVFDYANAPWDVSSPKDSHHITVGAQF